MKCSTLAAGLLITAVLCGSAVAQKVPEIRLAKPDARFPKEFSSITGLRELPDGRVLITDGIDETLLRLDLRAGKADTIGRSGQGPGEYKTPDLLFAWPGGGTLLVDLGNARLSFFDPGLKYVESSPIARGEPGRGMTMVVPQGVDDQGRIYFQGIMRGPGEGRADSGVVLRYDRRKNVIDTVAKVKLGEVKVTSSGSANNRSMSMRPVPLSPDDQWGVAGDGRLAIARMADYHLEWLVPGGRRVPGPATPWKPVPIREADKKEWVGDMANGLSIMMSNDNGRMSVRMGRGGPVGRDKDEEARIAQLEWPAGKPAFRSVRVAPNGDAWVERYVAAGTPREFDIFRSDGILIRKVILPVGRRLVGFGKGVVYLRETTEDELQYLEQYRLQ
jgi:hypothetical protein